MSTRAFFNEILRNDFYSFLQCAAAVVVPGGAFQPNWHLEAIGHQLNLVRLGRRKYLIINQPPRSLKSVTVSVAYVAWLLGKNPAMRIIVVSYNGKLAAELHRQFRTLVESDFYRRLFPNLEWAKQTDEEFVTTQGGGRLATSIGGQLTGRGGDLLIVDDPMNAADAQSEAARKIVADFFKSTLLSRANNKKTQAIIVVMQRLHEDDLAGILLEEGEWEHLNLPAIAPDDAVIPLGLGRVHQRKAGDVLHPEREDLAALEDLKRKMGSLVFSAQYQQSPLPLEGNLIKRAYIEPNMYADLPAPKEVRIIVQSWDIATAIGGTNDYAVCTTWLVTKAHVYLIHVWRGRLEFPMLRHKVIELALAHRADTILIEEAGPGLQLLQDLRVSAQGVMVRPIGCKPEGSKVDRMAAQSSRIEAGMVHLPKEAAWLDIYLTELLGFPNTRHDDQVDSTSQFLTWWWTRWRPRQMAIVGPIIVSGSRYDPFDAPRTW